ncbi:MAG: M23 family metallopeptidase [Bacteroidaceae bacterium]|nr:M23 family metallopeptidase [Bacteroidaceae bacterium]
MKSLKKRRKSIGRMSLLRRFTYRYRVSVVNEDEQKEVLGTRLSVFYFFVGIFLIGLIGALIGNRISLMNSQPYSVDSDYKLRQTVIDDALRVDSLMSVMETRNRYLSNIQDIIAGRVSTDTVIRIDSVSLQKSVELMEPTSREEEFVRQFEEAERYNITSQSVPMQDIRSMSLFRPTQGLVASSFNTLESHLGVDIAASPNQSVVSVLDGTVLVSSFTAESGYTICVVHPGELVSVYKHCESLLRKSGDKVRQGEVIALVGRNTGGGETPGSHLHFELWYQGQPLDPEKYILFQ